MPAIVAHFACQAGPPLTITFNGATATLAQGSHTVHLTRQPAADGYQYANGTETIRGRGRQLTYTAPPAPPTICHDFK